MKLGVCYYPEHWPVERWSVDARLLYAAGIRVARIGEFAWAKLEPAEGQFDWAWLDLAIGIFAGQGIDLVLGTPTAAPPAWLSHGYPETLPVDEQGRRRNFGGRRHYCPNHPTYRAFSRRIVAGLARRYGQRQEVIGWQIDNEYGESDTARCYCPACAAAFRGWLQRRYGSLEALNDAWGAVFWSQTYSAWEQISPPNLTLNAPNPSHALDYARFATDSYVEYQQEQVDLLRAAIRPGQQLTHNFMGLFSELNCFKLAAPLDFVSWDSYPTGYSERWGKLLYTPGEDRPAFTPDAGDPWIIGFAHAVMHGLLHRPFWIMEQQAGHINWGAYNPEPRAGNVRLWTWHAAAAGANGVVYFRDRAPCLAQEQYHSGLLSHDGEIDQGYREVQRLHQEQDQLDRLSAAPLQAGIALLLSYEDLWALQLQPHQQDFHYLRLCFRYYAALQQLGLPVEVASPDDSFERFRLVLAPSAHLGRPELGAKLEGFARQGGTVLLGVRSGFKRPDNRVTGSSLPGVYRSLVGVQVAAWHALPPGISYPLVGEIEGLSGAAEVWAEGLAPDSGAAVRTLASYARGPLAGRPALTVREFGAGRAYYLGWFPTRSQAQAVLGTIARRAGVETIAELSPGLIAAKRGPQTLVLNFTDERLAAKVGGETVQVAGRDLWLK